MRFLKITLILLIYVAYGCMYAQKTAYDINKKHHPDKLKEDLRILQKSIYKWHPAIFSYNSKDSLDIFFTALSGELDHPMTDFEFRYYLRKAITKIGCGHTGVSLSKKYAKAVKNITRKMIPIRVWISTDHLYVRSYLGNDSLLKKGDEILEIDSIPAKKVITLMRGIATSDGRNSTHKDRSIEEDFAIYFTIYKGFQNQHEIKFKRENKKELIATVFSIEVKDETESLATDTNWVINTDHSRLKLADYNPSVAIMDIDNFTGKHQRRFFRRSFRYIRKQNCKTLVIDLRGNGGGNAFRGNNFLCYFLKTPIHRMVFERKPIPVWPSRYFKTGVWGKLTPLLFTTNPLQYPRKRKWVHEFWFIKKYRNHFNGQLYVITDGGTFSMAAIAAAYLKYKVNAKIIGEETGGGEAGCNAMSFGNIVLPNTGAKVLIPIYHMRNIIPVEDLGHGIFPDYPIYQTIEDKILGKDKELEEVKKLTEK